MKTIVTSDPDEIQECMAEIRSGKWQYSCVDFFTEDHPIEMHPLGYPSPKNKKYMSLGIHEKINNRSYFIAAKKYGIETYAAIVNRFTFTNEQPI